MPTAMEPFIGRGVPLLEKDAFGQWRQRDEAVIDRLLTTGYGALSKLGLRHKQLGYVAEALNSGDLALACISLVRMQLPPLPSAGHARAMAKADGLLVKDNPDWEDEPRVPAGNPAGGQWRARVEGTRVLTSSRQRIEVTTPRRKRSVSSTRILRTRRKSPTSLACRSKTSSEFPQ